MNSTSGLDQQLPRVDVFFVAQAKLQGHNRGSSDWQFRFFLSKNI